MLQELPPQQVLVIYPTRITATTSTYNTSYKNYDHSKYISFMLPGLPPPQVHVIYATRITTTTRTYNTSYKNYHYNKYI